VERHHLVTFGLDKAAAQCLGAQIMTYQNNTIGFSGSLRAANAAVKPASRLAAGPFDVSPAGRENQTTALSDALITGLLVIYPALATVVAVVVCLFLSNPVGA
jgi:hypothetical protein